MEEREAYLLFLKIYLFIYLFLIIIMSIMLFVYRTEFFKNQYSLLMQVSDQVDTIDELSSMHDQDYRL